MSAENVELTRPVMSRATGSLNRSRASWLRTSSGAPAPTRPSMPETHVLKFRNGSAVEVREYSTRELEE
jgi:hypothetical protein